MILDNTTSPTDLGTVTPNAPDPLFDLKNFATADSRLKALRADYDQEVQYINKRREARENKINEDELRIKKTLLEDEFAIPQRLVAANIQRAVPSYINYLAKPERVLYFSQPTNADYSTAIIAPIAEHEKAFTLAMRGTGWLIPWIKAIDTMLLHGVGWAEVVFDDSLPEKSYIDHIAREDLIIPRKTRDIQQVEIFARRYHFTPYAAEQLGRALNFDMTEVYKLTRDTQVTRVENVHFYKVFMKIDGIVNIAWWHEKLDQKWLRAPVPFDIGELVLPSDLPTDKNTFEMALAMGALKIAPKPVTEYPIFQLTFQQTEQPHVLDLQGRASLDIHMQQALTQLATSVVNSYIRFSKLYVSVENQPGESPTSEDVGSLAHGSIHPRALNFFQPPPPNNTAISAINAFITMNAQESGDTNFAALTRKDTEKTAREISASQQESEVLSSSRIVLFSQTIVEVYRLRYAILSSQSRAFRANVFPPNQLPMLSVPWVFTAAGDIEITARMEKLQNLMQFYPIFANTPLRDSYLSYLVAEFFPDEAPEWMQTLNTVPKMQAMIQQLSALIQGLPVQEMLQKGELTPQEIQQIQMLLANAAQLSGNAGPTLGAAPSNSGPNQNHGGPAGPQAPQPPHPQSAGPGSLSHNPA